VLLASKRLGRPVKWMSTRSEAFLSDAQARDNVTEAELALDKDGIFLGLRVKTIAACRRLSAAALGLHGNLGTLAGVYRTPAMHADVTAVFTTPIRCGPIAATAGRKAPMSSSAWSTRGRRTGIDPVELRRRNYIPPEAMPFKTGLTFTYDCGEFERNMDLALELADCRRLRQARRAESKKSAASCAASASRTRSSARGGGFEGAEIRFDRSAARSRSFPAAITQGRGTRPFKQLVCDRLGVHPDRGPVRPGRHRQGVLRRGHRRLALGDHGRLGVLSGAIEKVHRQGQGRSPRICSSVDVADINFARDVLQPEDQPHADHAGCGAAAADPAKLPEGHGGRPVRDRGLQGRRGELPERMPRLRGRDRSRDRQVEIARYTWSTMSARCSIRCCCKGQIVGGVVQGIGQILMETSASTRRPAR
jgi:carbon-monoxide dehydrogenase large subunit